MRIPPFRLDRYPLGPLAAVAAVIGAFVTLALRTDPFLNPDSLAFQALARSLLAGRGFTYREPMLPGLDLFAFRAPVYPAFVAIGLALGGIGMVIGLQGALNGVVAALVGSVADRLGGGARAAWIAFALRFAWPQAWTASTQLLSESFYEALTVAATWLVLVGVERRRLAWCAGGGLAAALALLTRPVGVGAALALGVWLVLRDRRSTVAFGLAAVLAWAPWPVRNAMHLRAFVPFSTMGGITAWAGTTGEGVGPGFVWMTGHTDLGEVGLDRHFYQLARENVRRAPLQAVKRALGWGFLYLGPIRGRSGALWVPRFAMLAAVPALIFAASRERIALPLMIWAAQGVFLLPIMIIDRFRMPVEWCVVVAAALGLSTLADRIGGRRAALLAAAGIALSLAVTLLGART